MINFAVLFRSDDPADWVVEGGRPAPALGKISSANRMGGLPSYELDSDFEPKGFLVWERCVFKNRLDGPPKVLPCSYGAIAKHAPEGLHPLHGGTGSTDGPWWRYRPIIYDRVLDGWQGMGSQSELQWRYALHLMSNAKIVELYEMQLACDRAEELLKEHLSSWQLMELTLHEAFRVRGGHTGHTYLVKLGDGFQRVDETTNLELESFCLHPEGWLPHADVALATKWALEDPQLELETLEGARNTILQDETRDINPDLFYARDMERDALSFSA